MGLSLGSPPGADGEPAGAEARQAQLAAGLAAVGERIAAACSVSGRPREGVHLIVVTKTFPASDVRLLAGLGVRDVGESRDQEAAPKAAETADQGLRWHFVGRLQSNKARSIASYADVVHSADRPAVVTALAAGARRAGRVLEVLCQVSLDGDPARGGVGPEQLAALAESVAVEGSLRLRGVMAVPPLGTDPMAQFTELVRLADRLRRDHPGADWVSAGMSNDLEAAVAAGATHLRVGSAVLGSRPPLG